MSDVAIRAATAADLPTITEIYEHAVLFGTATFELIPPDLTEMTRRFESLVSGGFPYLVAAQDGCPLGYAYAGPYRPRPAYRFTVRYVDSVEALGPEARTLVAALSGGASEVSVLRPETRKEQPR